MRGVRLTALLCLLSACSTDPMPIDTDVIVIGGGIAGLSAALEASANGARAIVIEASSVAGGHAVKAGGFALVGTPLQQHKGFKDTPAIAYDDLMAWGEDPDPDWVRLFVDNSRSEIHDWLTRFGVKFTILLDTPESSVPRFHFAGGAAINVIVPMLREAVRRENLNFVMNAEAQSLTKTRNGLFSLRVRNTRSGTHHNYIAPSVIIATGGFESNLELVRKYYRPDGPGHSNAPERLLIGAGRYATGAGIRLGQSVEAKLLRMDHQAIFVNGLEDPRDPLRGLHVDNTAAIRIDADGHRFVNESANSKIIEAAVMNLEQRLHWLVFDNNGLKNLRIRGAVWLNRDTIKSEILDDPAVVHKADTISAMATAAGLAISPLQTTIDRYNTFVATGEDTDFSRFGSLKKTVLPQVKAISEPPFFAIRLLPMTRKSMGGLAIDTNTQVLGQDNQPIGGLFAAGEATGVAGINGSYGGSGTFLAPSVLTGRIAGLNAALSANRASTNLSGHTIIQPLASGDADSKPLTMTADQMENLINLDRAGYWHLNRSHAVILERTLACTNCHSSDWPTMPAMTVKQRMLQLETCTHCH